MVGMILFQPVPKRCGVGEGEDGLLFGRRRFLDHRLVLWLQCKFQRETAEVLHAMKCVVVGIVLVRGVDAAACDDGEIIAVAHQSYEPWLFTTIFAMDQNLQVID